MKKKSSSRYQQLAMGFAVSAFALLGMLSAQQHEANVVAATTAEHATDLTNYQTAGHCFTVKGRRIQSNYHVCRPLK